MLKFFRIVVILGVVFGLGYYTGQKPEQVKQKIREFSGVVLESTVGVDRQTRLQRQILEAKEGVIEGKALLLDHRFGEAHEEFERALQHLDQAGALDPSGPTGRKVETVKRKVREVQQTLAEGRTLPPHLLEDVRADLQSIIP